MRGKTLIFLIFLSFLLGSIGFALNINVEKAILSEDWENSFNILKKEDNNANSPIARLIMGHACLATNRNNESMLLFLSVKEGKDLKLWTEYTESFLSKYPNNHIAFYLSADAKARMGELKKAKEMFTKALEIKGNFALAYNARGVVEVLMNEWDNALMDFNKAIHFAPGFADAHYNLGTYWILLEAPEGAFEAFNKALAINHDFALAYNGRGCAYFGIGKHEYEAAIDDMEKAFELCPVLLPALSNKGLVLAAMMSKTLTKNKQLKPSIALTVKSNWVNKDFTELSKEQIQKLAKGDPIGALHAASKQSFAVAFESTQTLEKIKILTKNLSSAQRLKKQLVYMENLFGWYTYLMDKYTFVGASKLAKVIPEPHPSDSPRKATNKLVWKSLLDPGESLRVVTETGVQWIINHSESTLERLKARTLHLQNKSIKLNQVKNHALAEAISQGKDLSKTYIFGIGSMPMPKKNKIPIPEYSIPHQSKLIHFNVLPGAIGKNIAPPGKTPLVVIDGKTDAYRLGTMLRGFNDRGIQTLPVPSSMNAQSFGRMVGADRIIKITKETGSASWLSSTISYGPKPGGVTQDMSHAHVDLGNWPVITSFSLFYKASNYLEEQK